MIGKFKTFLLLSGSDVRPFLYLLVLFGALVPILNLFTPQDSILHLSDYHIALFGKYLTYGLLALSLDLIWGYCGILSLGHGAFFALGG